MKIKLQTRGGWTAGLRLPPSTVDTDLLPSAMRAKVDALVDAATNAAQPIGTDGVHKQTAPEAQSYEVTIDSADSQRILRGTDVDAAPEFMALVEWIRSQVVSDPK